MSLNRKRTASFILCGAALCLAALAGCALPMVRGTVCDVDGGVLPGVAVTVEGAGWQDVTDAHGQYQVRYTEGRVVLNFSKTGFAPARLSLDVPSGGRFSAGTVNMWRLPATQGVYLLKNSRYTQTVPVEPERFFVEDENVAFGSRRRPDVVTEDVAPRLVCLKMPRDGARLCRLEQALVALGDWNGQVARVNAWVAGPSEPVDLRPLDEPEQMLEEVRLPAELEPGEYALHWGALEGYTTIDTRMFGFRVVAPGAVDEEIPEEPESSAEQDMLEPEPVEDTEAPAGDEGVD